MKQISLAMVGFGNVGKATARLLMRKQELLEKQFGYHIQVTGIATARHGSAIDPSGINLSHSRHQGAALCSLIAETHWKASLRY